MKTLLVLLLSHCARLGLISSFFILGLQNKFPDKNKKMEWQRENMASSSNIMYIYQNKLWQNFARLPA
jgi:hypothetical protein